MNMTLLTILSDTEEQTQSNKKQLEVKVNTIQEVFFAPNWLQNYANDTAPCCPACSPRANLKHIIVGRHCVGLLTLTVPQTVATTKRRI